ncbi:MAG: nitrilase, partial [Gemmatimonadota bacterium]|nr:nitrilase [Gemmatimonadota bacterium]
YVEKSHYPDDLEILAEVEGSAEVLCRGGSAVYGPLGESIVGPLEGEEGVLYADLDLSAVPRGKFDFDVVGHYARPDVFRLHVNEAPQESVTTWEDEVP